MAAILWKCHRIRVQQDNFVSLWQGCVLCTMINYLLAFFFSLITFEHGNYVFAHGNLLIGALTWWVRLPSPITQSHASLASLRPTVELCKV